MRRVFEHCLTPILLNALADVPALRAKWLPLVRLAISAWPDGVDQAFIVARHEAGCLGVDLTYDMRDDMSVEIRIAHLKRCKCTPAVYIED